MANESKNAGIFSAVSFLSLCILCALALTSARAQGEPNKDNQRLVEERFQYSVPDAIKKVKQGDFLAVHVEEIVQAGAVEAIPALKEQFARPIDPTHKDDIDPGSKAKIASALVRLGDKNEIYWNFLVKQATEAVDADIPFPREFDAQGKILDDHFSPFFLQWAKDHNRSAGEAGDLAIYRFPAKLGFLAETGDPRGLPLLRRAMLSPNYMIQAMAAKGLAKLHDKDSIPVIIAACQNSPWAAPAIAEALIYFDDPEAQTAAEKFLPKDLLQALRDERRIPGHDPFAQ
jgi:HEAT repeat protein